MSTDPQSNDQPDVWGEAARQHLEQSPLGWLDTEWVLRQRVFPMVFGTDPGGWWTQEAMKGLGVPIGGRWLDLGCGGGAAEIDMAGNGLFDAMVAYDPSPGAIQVAEEQAAEADVTNIDFRSAEVNWIELEEAAFDVVHINMALHHVLELEHVLHQVNRALKPGGVFLANEFVGPSQFQFSPARMRRVQACLESLPERLRWNPIAKEVKTEQPRYPRAWWDEFDPTESVRSDEIPYLLGVNFPAYRRVDYGGNLLNLVLENIAQNFDPSRSEDAAHIAALFAAEDGTLLAEPSDFAYFVCPHGGAEALEAGRRIAEVSHGRFVRSNREPLEGADLDVLEGIANLQLESESGSARPVVGPLIAGAKRIVRRGLRFYIEPLAQQQSEYNEASLQIQRRLLADLQREVAELRNDNAALRRTLALRPEDRGSRRDSPA